MVHPQKRMLVINCMEGVLARVLELEAEMMEVEQREFHFYDNVIQALNLTPDEVMLNVPEIFTELRATTFRNRQNILESILHRRKRQEEMIRNAQMTMTRHYTVADFMGNSMDSQTNVDESEYFSRLEAILLIQRNQRCFMARQRVKEMMRPYLDRKLVERARGMGTPMIMLILSLRKKYVKKWVNFIEKKKAERQKIIEMRFLGMEPDPDYTTPFSVVAKQQLVFKKKRIAYEFEEEYLNKRSILHEHLLESEGPNMADDLKLNIRQWLLETRDLLGKFPPFPEEERGGSNILFSHKSVEEVEEDIKELLEALAMKVGKKKDKKKSKEKKKKDKKDKKKKDKKGKDEEPEVFKWTMPDSKSLPLLKKVVTVYSDYWYYRDESTNIAQKHDDLLLREEVNLQVSEKIRIEVDNTIRQELEKLTIVIDRAKANKKSKGKKSKEKKKAKKGKKGKKNKDLTADRTIEELYEELVMNDIIKKPDVTRVDDFIGSLSLIGSTMQESNHQPLPSLADVRQMVIQHIILPLESSVIHERSPLNR